MGKIIDLSGQRFGKLVVINASDVRIRRSIQWNCQCDCGNQTITRTATLLNGHTKSCGCLRGQHKNPIVAGRRFVHITAISIVGKCSSGSYIWACKCDCGKEFTTPSYCLLSGNKTSCGCFHPDSVTPTGYSRTILYKRYSNMMERCYNYSSISFKNYGGRGITVCDEWKKSPLKFIEWSKNNGFHKKLQIDRINNDGDYSPNNCRWTTSTINNHNSRFIKSTNKTGYTGVSFWKEHQKYYSELKHYKIRYNLGSFDTPEEAAIVRDAFIVNNNFNRKLNFQKKEVIEYINSKQKEAA